MVSLTNPMRVAITGLSLILCMFATFYFLVVWKTGLVYTHLFYVPIVLMSAWWRRKGVIIVFSLVLFLLICNLYFAPDVSIVNNLLRSTIFLFISILTSTIFEHRKRAEEKYRSLMEDAPIGLCNTDLKGKILYFNKRCEEVSGYSREEIVGKNGFKLGLFSDEIVKLFAKRIKNTLMGKPVPWIFRLNVRMDDGYGCTWMPN